MTGRVVVLLAVLLSCGRLVESEAPAGIFLPTHSIRGSTLLALGEGRLEVKDGCIWIVTTAGTRLLPIWPPGTRARLVAGRIEVIDSAGKGLVREGDNLRSVGGETVTSDNAHLAMRTVEPPMCRPDAFWLVGQVSSAGRASASPVQDVDAD